jgi:hypothetical protein
MSKVNRSHRDSCGRVFSAPRFWLRKMRRGSDSLDRLLEIGACDRAELYLRIATRHCWIESPITVDCNHERQQTE